MKNVKKAHKHAEVIKAWADGVDVQYRQDFTCQWEELPFDGVIGWHEDMEYRVKPREFPQSALSLDELNEIYNDDPHGSVRLGLKAVADAAIRQYILDLEKEAANGF